ncbi:hypothetical protein [Alteribacillus sp. YIM 98480]|uniref:hypothetical protein n=1 Tax=Alteribacillus sp. YIM 98480 TaxID=2606599 RepID=UPI00131CF434|nr:hypothetical protein [Alteribacillus sp. YIM 98480]
MRVDVSNLLWEMQKQVGVQEARELISLKTVEVESLLTYIDYLEQEVERNVG